MSNTKIRKKWLKWRRWENRLIKLSPHTVATRGHARAYNAWLVYKYIA